MDIPDLESWAAEGCLFCRHLLDRMADAEESIGGTRVLGSKKGPFLDLSMESAMFIMILTWRPIVQTDCILSACGHIMWHGFPMVA